MNEATKLLMKSEFDKTALDSAVLKLKGELLNEAADELSALRAENARLRTLLADVATMINDDTLEFALTAIKNDLEAK